MGVAIKRSGPENNPLHNHCLMVLVHLLLFIPCSTLVDDFLIHSTGFLFLKDRRLLINGYKICIVLTSQEIVYQKIHEFVLDIF